MRTLLVAGGAALYGGFVAAQVGLPPPTEPAPPSTPIVTPDDARQHGLEALSVVVAREGVPLPSNLSVYVKDVNAARQLGKALFHDMAVGSDGLQSCASCHYRAGADPRVKNQVNPGLLRRADTRNGDILGFSNAAGEPDVTFEAPLGPNSTVSRNDYPFVRDIGNGANVLQSPGSTTVSPAPGNRNDITSSQGVLFTHFTGVRRGGLVDKGSPLSDPIFNVKGTTTRRVPPRNTPSTLNAVFNFTNFWDGRAANEFNGVNPFGKADVTARIFKAQGSSIVQTAVDLKNASLASQASGPPLSDFEMSYGGDGSFRIFAQLGRKLLTRRALDGQAVAADDSLLGGLRYSTGKGLTKTYEQLIAAAFKPEYVTASKRMKFKNSKRFNRSVNHFGITLGTSELAASDASPANTFSLAEANFAFFWGISIMLYEATLITDQTPFDNWMRTGSDPKFGSAELAGLNVFAGKGHCINCHGGPELTHASVRNAEKGKNVIEPMIHGDRRSTLYDNGYYNIGVTPTVDDIARGARDPWGAPLSFARQFAANAEGLESYPFSITGSPLQKLGCDPHDASGAACDSRVLGFVDDSSQFHPVCRDTDLDRQCSPSDELILKRVSVDGAFKTPSLRNVADTAPYFHNGGVATLREVVEFYNRGGNFCRINRPDLDPDIQGLGLSEDEKSNLVAFLLALTDPRVVVRKAPFDTPEFKVPNGHTGTAQSVTPVPTKSTTTPAQAKDDLLVIPAVGRNGGTRLLGFLEGPGVTDVALQHSYNPVSGGICSAEDPVVVEEPVDVAEGPAAPEEEVFEPTDPLEATPEPAPVDVEAAPATEVVD